MDEGILITLIEEAGATARNAQDRISDVFTGGQDAAVEVITGGQQTVGGIASDVTRIPRDVAQPVSEAASSPFRAAKWLIGGTVVLLLGDQLLNDGRLLKTFTG